MKYRPWNGVFLSDKYLSGVETAEGITASILRLYHQYGVQPLVESNITSAAELQRCHALMEQAVRCGQGGSQERVVKETTIPCSIALNH